MGKFVDLSGNRFGKLTALRIEEKRGNYYYYLCRCDCGNMKIVRGTNLKDGSIRSCGCLADESKRNNHKKKLNSYSIDCNTVFVKLTNSEKIMMCDIEDWERLKKYTWCIDKYGYAKTTKQDGKNVKFHIMVMGNRPGMVVDHADRNTLNNRKNNLRFVSQQVNCINTGVPKNNTSGVKGVSEVKGKNKWDAYIKVNYKKIFLGRFDTKEEAIAARKVGEEKYYLPQLESRTG